MFCKPLGRPLFGKRRATDVSLGGMRLYSDEPAAVHDRLELELFLPGDRTAMCDVEVVWIDELPAGGPARYDVGVKFLGITPEVRALVAEVLHHEGE